MCVCVCVCVRVCINKYIYIYIYIYIIGWPLQCKILATPLYINYQAWFIVLKCFRSRFVVTSLFVLLMLVAGLALTDAWRSVCGHQTYNPAFNMCCGGRIVHKPLNGACCGPQAYNRHVNMCCRGRLQHKPFNGACCGDQAYNSRFQKCCNGRVC